MQHPFFASLDEQELALLLIMLSLGGAEHLPALQHLPQDVAARLSDKAQALLQISADKRIPLMVRELKVGLENQGRRGLERVDPSWIVWHLKGESPRVVATLLVSLPTTLIRSILRRLPVAVRRQLPPRAEVKNIPSSLASDIRTLFESRFAAMPTRDSGPFRCRDIIHLERRELFVLVRDLGLTELGQAFVSVGKMALLELCRRLPREHADALVLAVKTASRVDLPDAKTAQRFLSRVVANFANTAELLQKSGLWRLAKASLGEEKAYHAALCQRLPWQAAQYLQSYVDKAQDMEDVTPEVQARLQDAILVRLVSLSRQQLLDSAWQNVTMQYHDRRAALAALEPWPAEVGSVGEALATPPQSKLAAGLHDAFNDNSSVAALHEDDDPFNAAASDDA